MVNQDRNIFGAAMVEAGDADGMVTGVTRNYSSALEEVRRVIDVKPGHRLIGVSIVLSRGRTVLVADTAITEMPSAADLAEIAIEAAMPPAGSAPNRASPSSLLDLRPAARRALGEGDRGGEDPRRPPGRFRYDGEMAADVALNPELMQAYPFCG